MTPGALLERERVLAELSSYLDEARSGHGVMVLVGGEAGIGKTTLVRRFCRDVAPASTVLIGACDALSTPRPLGPLLDMAPDLGDEFTVALGSPNRRDACFDHFLHALRSPVTSIVAVLEDVHWADDATRDLLRFIGRRIATTKALVIATYRDDEVGYGHPLRTVLGDLATAAAVRRMTLPALSSEAVAKLALGSGVDPAALHRTTHGNPFFVVEVLAAQGGGLPPTVRDAITARASRLSDRARGALEEVSVVGAAIDTPLLAALDIGSDAIEDCVARGMLESTDGGYAFRHELVRQSMYGSIPTARRRALHRRVLRVLETATPRRDDLATLAHHAAEAADVEAILRLAPAAGARAAELGAHREARAQYARTLPYLDALPPRGRAELLELYAAECSLVERPEECVRVRQELVAAWTALGDSTRLGSNLSMLATELVGQGDNQGAEIASRRAIEMLEPLGTGRALARALRVQAHLCMLDRDSVEAVSWGMRAIDVARDVGDDAGLAAAHMTVGAALLVGDDGRADTHLDASLEIAQRHGLVHTIAHVHCNRGSGAGEFHRFDVAAEALTQAIAVAEAHDLDSVRLYSLAWLGLTRMYEGRWDEAADLAHRVIDFPGVSTIARIMALVALGRLRARRGDPEANDALDEALDLALPTGTLQRIGAVRSARAEAAALAGDTAAVRDEANAAYALAERHRHPWFVGELGYWLWTTGDLDTLPPYAAAPFVLHVDGRPDEAAAAWRALGCPFEEFRAWAEVGSEAALMSALEGFVSLGARPAAARTAGRLRDLGVRGVPRGPSERTRDHPALLTPREAEILKGLASGLRNHEIAERHSVSPRTVDHQVSSVLAKLGVRSRAQAVAEAHRLGLVGRDGGPGALP
ncbi:AAA family ATPase [soil metagenome]